MQSPVNVLFHYGQRRTVSYPWDRLAQDMRALRLDQPALSFAQLVDAALDVVKDGLPPLSVELDFGDHNPFHCGWERFVKCLARPELQKHADVLAMVRTAVQMINGCTDLEPAK